MMPDPRPTVLVVDDDEAVRSVLAAGLADAGFRTVEASTGAEALRLAAQGPAALVLDVKLPDIDGFDVCRRLRASALTSSIPVLMVSGLFTTDAHRAAGLDCGADLYITKPVTPRGLAVAIDTLLRLRRAADEAHLGLAHARLLAGHLSGTLSLSEVLERAGEVARALIGADFVGVRLLDPATRKLSVLSAGGERTPEGAPVPLGLSTTVLAERRTIAVEDAAVDPRITNRDWVRRQGAVSMLISPLVIGDEPMGTLVCLSRTRRQWSGEDVMRAETIAAHAAAAIRNARLYEASERRRRTAESLADIDRMISESLDPAEVGQRVVDSLRQLLDGDAGVYLVDSLTEDLRLASYSGTSLWPGVLARGVGSVGLAAQERRSVTAPDVLTDPRIVLTPELREYLIRLPHVRSVLSTPLVVHDRLIGVLCIAGATGRVFTDEEVAVAGAFGSHAAFALENSRLYDDSQRRRRVAESLAEVSLLMSQSLDPAEVGERVVESLRRLLEGEAVGLYRLDAGTGQLRLTSRSQASDWAAELLPGEGASGLALGQSRPITTTDILADERIRLSDDLRRRIERSQNRANLTVPLLVRGRVIGAVTISDRAGRVFTAEEVSVAAAFASHAAIALENSRLYDESERRRRVAESLAEVSLLMSQSLEPAEVSERVVESLRRLLDADGVGLYLEERGTGALVLTNGSRRLDWLPRLRPTEGASGLAIRQRRPVTSPDVRADSRITMFDEHRESLQRSPYRAVLAVPLVVRDRAIGTVVLRSTVGRIFTDEEISVATAFASHATIALENSRLFAERLEIEAQLAARERKQAAIADLGREVIAAADVETLLETAVPIVAGTLGVDALGVFETAQDGAALVLRAGVGWTDAPGLTVDGGRVADRLAALTRQDAIVFENEDTGSSMLTAEQIARHRIRSGVEMVVEGLIPPFGALGAYSTWARRFTDDDVTFLRSAVSVIGMAIVRLRTESALRRHAGRLRIMREIDHAILAARSSREIANVALGHVAKVLPIWRASVTLFDFEESTALLFAVTGAGEDVVPPGVAHPLRDVGREGLAELTAGRAHFVRSVTPDTSGAVDQVLAAYGMRAYFRVPLTVRGELIGSLNLSFDRPDAFSGEDVEIAREVAEPLAVAIEQARLHEHVLSSRARLQALSRRMVEIAETERAHLARELHDEIGQLLTGLKLSLEALERHADAAAAPGLVAAERQVTEVMARVRALSLDLRPAALDDLGLLDALGELFARYTGQTRVRVTFKQSGLDGRRFAREVETAAYRIVQESLTNVARHAGVGTVTVRLWADDAHLGVQIEDRGAGFELVGTGGAERVGLAGMRERAALVGARLEIESAPGAGTRITAEFPLRG